MCVLCVRTQARSNKKGLKKMASGLSRDTKELKYKGSRALIKFGSSTGEFGYKLTNVYV